MTPQCLAAIAIWVLVFGAFAFTQRSPGVIAAGLVFGWLFLPNFTFDMPVGPSCDKPMLVAMVSAVAALAIPVPRKAGITLSWTDLPALGMTVFAVPPSIITGLGLTDGLWSACENFWVWTVPFFIGRRVFCTPERAAVLLRVLLAGGLLYVGFCLFEMKMSPRLHKIVYGLEPREGQNYFTQAVRYGLWRPTVFMEHGLALAFLMSGISILAWWASLTGTVEKILGVSARTVAWVLSITTLLCVSSGAVIIMAVGYFSVRMFRFRMGRYVLLAATMIPVVYPVSRMLGSSTFVNAVISMAEAASSQLGSERSGSFQFRVDNEDDMLQSWKNNPLFGAARKFRHLGERARAVTDSYWIIMLGRFGLLGWMSWTAMMCLPAFLLVLRRNVWLSGGAMVGQCFALLAVLFAIDGQLNAMPNPIFVVMAGAALGLSGQSVAESVRPAQRESAAPKKPVRRLWPAGSVRQVFAY